MKVVSFFSGCGGLDLGFEQAGFKVIYAIDYDKSVAQTYITNHPSTVYNTRDIRTLTNDEIPECDGFIGGPPCQSWSVGGKQLGLEDERGKLFLEYIKIINWKKPKFFVIENVEGIILEKHLQTFLGFLNDLQKCGYSIFYDKLNAADFSIPQDRNRVFVIGFKKELNIRFEFPTKHERKISLKQAIGDINVPPFEYTNYVDSLKYNGRFFNHDVFIGPFDSKFMARNRVRNWDEQSFTIQALAKNCPLHPQAPKMVYINQNCREFVRGQEHLYRRLSIRECARIQTFPDSFKFYYQNIKDGYKMVGNAVPPRLAYNIANSIKKSLNHTIIPDSSYCLIGYFKNQDHLEAIKMNKIYYIRFGINKDLFKLPLGSRNPSYLLLHNKEKKYAFKLIESEPQISTKDHLLSLNFKPSHDVYLTFRIEKEIDLSILDHVKIRKGRKGAIPFLITI